MHNPYKNKHRVPVVKNKQDVMREILKCKASLEYFAWTFAWIQHPVRGRIKLDEYPFLYSLMKEITTNRFNLINKCRQLHISTTMAVYISWLILFHNDKEVLVIATKSDVAKNMIKKIRFVFKCLPKWLLSGVKLLDNNKQSVTLSNGSSVKAIPTTEDAGRSEGLSLLVIDEAAFIKNVDPEILWTAAYSTLSTGGKAVVLSTPNGASGWYYRKWMEAIAGQNDFHPIELKWNVHPLRDQKWRDEQDRQLGKKKAAQECDASFITSGDSIIDAEILAWYKTTQIKSPIEKIGLDKMFWIYKYPETGHRYIIPADCSRGDAGSKSAFVVIDIDLMEVVADYSGLMLPNNFGHMLVEAAIYYNEALLIPENNNIGPMAIQAIIDDEYQNLFYTLKASDQIIDPINMPKGLLLDELRIAGFITSGKTRHLIVEKMVQIVENKLMDIPSERLIDQMYNFKMIAGKPKADKGCNDDLVLAFAIGSWNTDISLKLTCMKEQLSKAMMGATARITSSLNTPGAMMMQNKVNSKENYNNYYMMPVGNRGSETEYLDLYSMLIKN